MVSDSDDFSLSQLAVRASDHHVLPIVASLHASVWIERERKKEKKNDVLIPNKKIVRKFAST